MDVKTEDIQAEVWRIGAKIYAPASLLIVRDGPSADGAPYVDTSHGRLAFVSSERGIEIFRKYAGTVEDLLYFFFRDVTEQMGVKYELDNRVGGQDSRRVYFSRWIFLLDQISAEWGDRARREVQEVLVAAPYNDFGGV